MKASDLTNEELAKELEKGSSNYDPCEDDGEVGTNEILREAAARLRNSHVMAFSDENLRLKDIIADERAQHTSAEARKNAELENIRRLLKVAEDAIDKVYRCADKDNHLLIMRISDEALAAIREEGVAK